MSTKKQLSNAYADHMCGICDTYYNPRPPSANCKAGGGDKLGRKLRRILPRGKTWRRLRRIEDSA